MTRDDIVREAREWVGTPYHEQARVKGRGCDCMGLVAGVARSLGREEDAPRWNYSEVINPHELIAGLEAQFDRAEEALPSDVLLLRIGGKPQHLAIYCGDNRMVHTYGVGPKKVIEVPMGHAWWGALAGVWSWRGVE